MEEKEISKTKNIIIILLALIVGGFEGYVPLLCWMFLIMNIIFLIFNKKSIVLRKFVSWSLVGFFCGYFTSCAIIVNQVEEDMKKMEQESKARKEKLNSLFNFD